MAAREQPIAGVIFDMDGVLCLSEPFIAEAACWMFAQTHGRKVSHQDFAPFVGMGEDRFLGGVAEKYSVPLVMPRDKQRTYEIYLEIIQGQLQPLPGVHEYLADCRRRGLKLAVATSADRVKLEGNLREIGLPLASFDASVNGDEIQKKKPHPDIFLLAAKRLGLTPSACLVIEDAPSGVQAAKAGGFRCLGLTTTFSAERLRETGADWIAPDLAHVPDAVTTVLGSDLPTPHPQAMPAQERSRERQRADAAERLRNAEHPLAGARGYIAAPAALDPRLPPPLRILFVASECTPFAKSGGLGDVVAGLAKELRRQGHDARVLIPLYGFIDRAQRNIQFLRAGCAHWDRGREYWYGLHGGRLDDEVPVWFLDHAQYFARPNLYGSVDDPLRFGLLSKAALQVCKDEAFIPDVIHVHDWMTAITAVYLKTWDRVLSPLSGTASVLTIHNIGYQGKFPGGILPSLGIGWEHFTPSKFEDYGDINLLKAGLHFADAITTVSPTHAREIHEPAGGQGLAPFINDRSADVFGILNGCDYEHWDPAIDKHLPARYTAEDLAGKAVCKAALQRRLGLEVRADVPVFGVVSRFASQKGFELLVTALPRMLDNMVAQFVALGSGDVATETFFRSLPARYPGRAGSVVGFDIELSHLIEAGADFFVMPSLYEPCGLNQMYSLRYGTLPIVRATGGLHDTVDNYDEATGQEKGFKFWAPTADALYFTMGWANATWWDRPQHIAQLRRQAMARNFSWAESARRYVEVYQHAMVNRRQLA